jgi:anaerobic magnesium-protoporphyrin IX monomethyl ester cyclase
MFNFFRRRREDSRREKSKILWLDLGDLGDLVNPSGPHEQWQDHGLGLLRTIMHQNGIMTDILSTRLITEWPQLEKQLPGYEVMLMNVRSYTFPVARKAAQIFKQINPNGIVLTGGMHATVAVDEMLEVPEFDLICKGPGEKTIVDMVKDPHAYPRVVEGEGAKSMAEWPMIDRTLWPKPVSKHLVWLGAAAGRDDAHQPGVSLAMRLLQRKLLHPPHGTQAGRYDHRRTQHAG